MIHTNRIKPGSIVVVIVTAFLLCVSLFPYYYMLLQSLLPWEKVDKTIVPGGLSLISYQSLLHPADNSDPFVWIRALINSFIVSVPTALISVAVGLLTGFASSKLNYKGKKAIYSSLLFQMFFPVVVLLVPRYMIVKPLANTYFGMILPMCISVWGVFMYINYFRTVPNSIFEAARIDGASNFKCLYKIALPATKSISIIVFLSIFMMRWTDLMWDMLIAPKQEMQTLNVMISARINSVMSIPGTMYAASVVLTLPVIIIFLIFSKHFREGIDFMLK